MLPFSLTWKIIGMHAFLNCGKFIQSPKHQTGRYHSPLCDPTPPPPQPTQKTLMTSLGLGSTGSLQQDRESNFIPNLEGVTHKTTYVSTNYSLAQTQFPFLRFLQM